MSHSVDSDARVNVSFPAVPDEVGRVAAIVDLLARWQLIPPEIVYGVNLVVDEIVSNVVQHADAPAGSKVVFALGFGPGRLSLRFAWPGLRFDPTTYSGSRPVTASGDLSVGLGVGLGLVNAFADDLRYHWDGRLNVLDLDRSFGPDSETFLSGLPHRS